MPGRMRQYMEHAEDYVKGDKMVELVVKIKNMKLYAEIAPDLSTEKFLFGFYLHMNREVHEKRWYAKESKAIFDLDENGVYHVTAFIKELETDSISTIESEAIWFLAGRKPESFPFLRIEEMEMTNYCNLSCPNCCTPTTLFHRGFIDDQTVLSELSWMQKRQTLNYHRQGEPLLHKSLAKYIRWGVEAGIKPVISTNGELLDAELLDELYRSGLRRLVITLHTLASLRHFLDTIDYFDSHNIDIVHFSQQAIPISNDVVYFSGKLLDLSEDTDYSKEVRESIPSLTERQQSFLQLTPTHTWAGNTPGTKHMLMEASVIEKRKSCYFINKRVINVRWDGTIVGCCFDSENENEIGHIRDYPNIEIDFSKYKLCSYCDNNWAVANSDLT